MQNLGSQPVFGIGPAKRPGRPCPSEAAQGVDLIPLSGVGEVVGGFGEVSR